MKMASIRLRWRSAFDVPARQSDEIWSRKPARDRENGGAFRGVVQLVLEVLP